MASNALDAQKGADFFQFLFIAVQHINVTQMRLHAKRPTVQLTICHHKTELYSILFKQRN